jgi:hypothetical protein
LIPSTGFIEIPETAGDALRKTTPPVRLTADVFAGTRPAAGEHLNPDPPELLAKIARTALTFVS